jgi:hypothetical protein
MITEGSICPAIHINIEKGTVKYNIEVKKWCICEGHFHEEFIGLEVTRVQSVSESKAMKT